MDQDLLATLCLPLIFSLLAGAYVFRRFPERRPALLLNLILFQFVGAYAVHHEPSAELLVLLGLHALGVCIMLVRHIQTPPPQPALVRHKN